MDKLIEKFGDLSYEIFAILVPGLFGILLSVLLFSYCQITFASISIEETIFVKMMLFETKDYKFFQIVFFGALLYITGQFSTSFSKSTFEFNADKVLRKDQYVRRYLYGLISWFAWFPVRRKSSDSIFPHVSLAPLAVILNNLGYQITNQGTNVVWLDIFGPASRFLAVVNQKSRIQTYQNKYTLHRTLAVQLSIFNKLMIIAIISYIVTIMVGATARYDNFIISGVAIVGVSFILQKNFVKSFNRFWTEYGSQICYELQAVHSAKTHNYLESKK